MPKKIAKKKKQEKKRLKKIARFHVLLSFGLFVIYLGLSFVYSPEFLLSDIRGKFQALADETIAVTGRVLGPPAKPVVTGVATCNNGTLFVTLSWPSDEGSDSFDVSRDGLPLINDLINSQYQDDLVAVGRTYEYVVTAYGSMGVGFAISDPVFVTTPAQCSIVLPDPTVSVISLSGKNIASFTGTPETTDLRPEFTGTTNIPNARINILLYNEIIASADIDANSLGFWSWTPPINLSLGAHTLVVLATDPLDPVRTASVSQDFNIVKKKTASSDNEDTGSSSTKKTTNIAPNIPGAKKPGKFSEIGVPVDFSLELGNTEVFQSKELETKITILRLDPQYENAQGVVRYSILDEKGTEQESFLDDAVLQSGKIIKRNIPVPAYFRSGKYHLRAEILLGQYNISRSEAFSVLPLPVLKLGGGVALTYPEILSRLGTVALWLLIALFIWLFLFSREYWLYLHALRHVTENNLVKMGLFGERKGKGVSH